MTTVQSGRLLRRYRTPEFGEENLIPDSIRNEDGSLSTNPEWEAAEYEECFILNGRRLPPMTQYGLFREMNKSGRATP